MLGDAVPHRVRDGLDRVPRRLQHAQQRPGRRGGVGRRTVGLVADPQAERVVLGREPGQRRRQLDGPVAGRDQDVDLGRAVRRVGWFAVPGVPARRGHRIPSVARIRPTIAVVEWSDR